MYVKRLQDGELVFGSSSDCSIIGTTAALIGAAVIGAGASVAAGSMGASAAKSASNTQAAAADRATQLQSDIYQQNRADSAPWRETGSNALKMLADAIGVNGPEGTASATSAFQKGPGYDFAFNEGQRAVDRGMAAKGSVQSGARTKAQTRFGQGTANQEFSGWINKLGVLAGVGQTANAQQQQGAQAYAANTGNLMQDAAAARASGYVGSANAWSGATNNLSRLAGSLVPQPSNVINNYSNSGGGMFNGGYLAPFDSSAAAMGF